MFPIPTKGEMRKKILETGITSDLVDLFQSNRSNDAVKYCASQALIVLDSGSVLSFFLSVLLMPHADVPQSSIPTEDIITWLVRTVGYLWRYQRTVKLLSEIVKNGTSALRWYVVL